MKYQKALYFVPDSARNRLHFFLIMPTRIDDLLRMAMSFGASDLHLRAGSYPVIRVTGELKPLSGVSRLSQDETLEMAFSMMSNRPQKKKAAVRFELPLDQVVSH